MKAPRRELAAVALVLVLVGASALSLLRPAAASPQISLEGTAVDYVSGTFLDVTPTSLSVGDLMILQVSTDGNRSITVPSGWQLRGVAGQTNALRQWIYTKVATAADVGQSIPVTSDAPGSWGLNTLFAYYSGVDTVNPIRDFSARLWNDASVMDIDYVTPPDYTDGFEDVVFVGAVIEEPSTMASALGVLNRRFAITTMPGTATILDNANNFSNQGPFTITSNASAGVQGNLTMLGLNPIGAPAPTYSLSGSIFLDEVGDGLGGGGVGSGSDPYITAIPNVELYLDDGDGTLDAGDSLVAAMLPNGGTFSVANLANGDYFVVIDGQSVSAMAGTLAEQTWGPTGALCDDGTGVTYERTSAGACYGGADATASDDLSSLSSREHVAVVTIAGASVTGVDFGFSHRVVTNTRPTGSDDYSSASIFAQGTIEQFVQNANNLAGADAMRFVPTVPVDDVDATGIGFWRIGGSTDLVIDDAFTSLRGEPYDHTDGQTVVRPNTTTPPPFTAGTTPMTGIGDMVPPQLLIEGPAIVVNADAGLLADLAVHKPGGAASVEMRGDSGSVQAIYVGIDPRGDPLSSPSSVGIDLFGSGGFIDDTWIAHSTSAGVQLESVAGTWVITDSLITDITGWTAINIDSTAPLSIMGSRIEGNAVNGIWAKPSTGPLVLDEVSIVSNGESGALLEGVDADITNSVFSANGGAGIRVGPTATARISQSHFDNSEGAHNADLSIDLLGSGDQLHGGTAPYATLNDTTDADVGGNDLLNKPVITAADVSGGTLTLEGWAPAGSTVEVFRSSIHPSGFGGGAAYIGSFVEGGPLDTDATTSGYQNGSGTEISGHRFSVSIPATGLVQGDDVTATATVGGLTSEFSNSETTAPAAVATSVDVEVLLDAGADGVGPFVSDPWTLVLYRDDGDGVFGPGDVAVDVSSSPPLTAPTTGTHWLVLNPHTHSPSSGSIPTDAWAEQIGGDVGSLCYDAAAGATVELAVAGPCVGGRSPASDDPTSLATREHVMRIEATGAPISKTITMSYDAVTVTRDGDDDLGSDRTIQGSFRQFLLNANAGVADSMRFLPIEPTNLTDPASGGDSWQAVASSSFPPLTATDVVIDGTAYDWADLTTVVDTRPGGIAVLPVGTMAIAVPDISYPELTLRGGDFILDGADRTIVRDIAVSASLDFAIEIHNSEDVLVDSTFLGVDANGLPPAGVPTLQGLHIDNGSSGTLRHSYVADNQHVGLNILAGTQQWTVEQSLLEGNGGTTGLAAINANAPVAITESAVLDSFATGVWLLAGAAGSTIDASTIGRNGTGGLAWAAGIDAVGEVTVFESVVRNNIGAGVKVAADLTGAEISQSNFWGNGTGTGQIGIDLLSTADDAAAGSAPFRSLNDDGDVDTGGNGLLNTVVFESAGIHGADLHLRGFAPAGSVIEFFVASSDNPDPEGDRYFVTLVEGGADDTDGSTGAYSTSRGSDSNAERFAFQIPRPGVVSPGTNLVATATTASGTSEFSDAMAVFGSSAPVLGPSSVFTVAEGGILFTPIEVFDADPGDTITFQLNSGPDPIPAGLSIGFSSGAMIWNAPTEADGPSLHNLTVQATDSYGNVTTFPVTVVVTETNSPPVVSTASTGIVMFAGASLASTPTVVDPDTPANDHVWSITGLPPGITFDPQTGQMTGTVPSTTPSGVYTVSVTATDDGSPPLSDTETFTITIVGLEPPVADAGPDVTLAPGELFDLLGVATDVDGWISTWEWTGTTESFLPVSAQNVLGASWTAPGTYPVSLEVTDDDGQPDTDTMIVTVTSGVVTATLSDQSTVNGGNGTAGGSTWQPAVGITLLNEYDEPMAVPMVVTVEFAFSDGTVLTASCTTNPPSSFCVAQTVGQSMLLSGATATVVDVTGADLDSWNSTPLFLPNTGFVPPTTTTTTTTAPPTTTTTTTVPPTTTTTLPPTTTTTSTTTTSTSTTTTSLPPTTTTTTTAPPTTTTTAPPTTTTVPTTVPPTTTTAPPTTTTVPPTTTSTTVPPTTTTAPPTTTSTTAPPTTTTTAPPATTTSFVVPPATTTTTFVVPPTVTTTTRVPATTTTTAATTTTTVATTTTTAAPIIIVVVPPPVTTTTTRPSVSVPATVPPTTTTTPIATTTTAAVPTTTIPPTTSTTVPRQLAFVSTIDVRDDEFFVLDGLGVDIDVLGNDRVSPPGPLRLVSIGKPEVGRFEEGRGGTLRYVAPDGWTGVVRVDYVAAAPDGTEGSGSVRIIVGAPIARPDSVTLDDYRPRTIDVLVNDLATPGGRLEVLGFTQVDGGYVELADDGRLLFTPQPGFVGAATFTYEIVDEVGRKAVAEVTVNVPAAAAATGADRARQVGADLLTVESSGTAAPEPQPVPGFGEQGLVLFVSAVFQQLGSLRLPLLQAALAVLWAGAVAGLLPLFSRRHSMWRVHGVPRNETLNAVSSPGDGDSVFRFTADADNIWSTGRARRVDGHRWHKVDTPNGPGWLPVEKLRRVRTSSRRRTLSTVEAN